ncbi:unnamed protein product [Echinostoma caproni]|uniref:NR LBD domain-containing protein n=1 Tax=Echinostoma caproni TaxID=27848 RepID=A0A183ATC6_9TREM|nr:unnamed protein product [Echinostoma caproni]
MDSEGDGLHKHAVANSGLSEPMLEGSEKLARIRLACSRDSSTPSPSSVTTVSVRTQSPGSSNPSPRVSVTSPTPTDGRDTSPSGCPPAPAHGGLLYSLLVGSEIGSSSGLCCSPLRTMSTPTRASSGTSSIPGGLRRSHTQMSLDIDDTVNEDVESDPIMDIDRPSKRLETGSRLAAVLTASEMGALNGTTLANGHNTSISPSKLCEQQKFHHLHTSHPVSGSSLQTARALRLPTSTSIGAAGLTVSTTTTTTTTKTLQSNLSLTHGPLVPPIIIQPILSSNQSSGYNSAAFNPSPLTSLSTDSGLDEPVDLTGHGSVQTNGLAQLALHSLRPPDTNDSLQLVQLAKKTARPVQARVSEWMRQVAEFVALSAPVLQTMDFGPINRNVRAGNGRSRGLVDMDMWLGLLAKCWHRLLALSMVENALDLVVVEHTLSNELIAAEARQAAQLDQIGLPWILLPEVRQAGGMQMILADRTRRPDRKFANAFMQFLSEIRQASLSAQEFYLLRHVILLTGEHFGVTRVGGVYNIFLFHFRVINSRQSKPHSHEDLLFSDGNR